MSALENYWRFEVGETAEVLLNLCDEGSEGLDYLVPDSGEGCYLILLDSTIEQEQAAQLLCQKAASVLTPTSEMMETLNREVFLYTFEWNEDGELEVIKKEKAI